MDFANNLTGFFATPAWMGLSFLLGLWLGHRLALANDRRKEFNTAAVVFIDFLLAERGNPDPNRSRPGDAAMWGLSARIGLMRRRGFCTAWKRYCEACKADGIRDALGQSYYGNKPNISAAADACLGFLKPR